jgi:predicted amidohydrolase
MGTTGGIRVGVAQIESRLGDLSANLDRHLSFVARARERGVDCLLFPEMSLTGHGTGPLTLDLARARDDPIFDALARAAGPMCTIVGRVVEGPAAQLYNTALVLRDGAVVFQHRKINRATYGGLGEG